MAIAVFLCNAVLQLHTDVFTCFTSLLLCCCVSFCSLLDGVCLSGNKRITYLLTYNHYVSSCWIFLNLVCIIRLLCFFCRVTLGELIQFTAAACCSLQWRRQDLLKGGAKIELISWGTQSLVDFGAGCSSCSMANSFVTNAVCLY